MKILIADAGSTKIEWSVVADGQLSRKVITAGFNAAVHPQQRLSDALTDTAEGRSLVGEQFGGVYFYGAGCLPGEPTEWTSETLSRIWPGAKVEVNSDLLGAARALCGRQPGIACILGTGSNSCLYDGKRIVRNTPSLGYILGDEGGGANLGRRLLTAVYKRLLPEQLRHKFMERYDLAQARLIECVYRGEAPNTFMASFVPFLSENIEEAAIRRIVFDSFVEFLGHNVEQYEGCHSLPVNFVGSVAKHFVEVLSDALAHKKMTLGQVLASPTEGIIRYHLPAKG